jgi:hypothetical protein
MATLSISFDALLTYKVGSLDILSEHTKTNDLEGGTRTKK